MFFSGSLLGHGHAHPPRDCVQKALGGAGRGGAGARIWLCRVKDLWDLLAGSLQAGRLGRSADKVSKGQGETEEIARPQTASLSWGGV